MEDLKGKNAVVIGLANDRSLAWGIAESLRERGCEIAVSYLNEKMERRARPLAEGLGAKVIAPLDITQEGQAESFFAEVKSKMGHVDYLIHAVAYAEREDLEGQFLNTSRSGFHTAMDISVYSLIELSRLAVPLMKSGGNILTLSYLGAVRVKPHYNVMGVAKAALEASVRYLAYELGPQKITVNAISAGAVRTLSSSGIKDFRKWMAESEAALPLQENISSKDVGELAAFLCSPGAIHITGETIYVDSGAHIM